MIIGQLSMPSKSNELNVFLDLDRTLFNTSLFDEERWKLLARLYPEVIDLETEQARQTKFYVYRGKLYFYDFSAHMKNLGLDVERIYRQITDSHLADGRLEHQGVLRLINFLRGLGQVQVLTFGAEDYQSLKISLCPSLRNVKSIITDQEKGVFFRSHSHLPGEVWMIDDKPIDNLPASVNFIQASMDGLEIKEQDWPVIDDLMKIPQIIGER